MVFDLERASDRLKLNDPELALDALAGRPQKLIRLRYHLPILRNMGTHMKTTVEISDSLFIEAKRHAAKNGATLRALIEQGLKLALKQPVAGAGYQPRDCRVKGDGRVEAARASGWRVLREIANER